MSAQNVASESSSLSGRTETDPPQFDRWSDPNNRAIRSERLPRKFAVMQPSAGCRAGVGRRRAGVALLAGLMAAGLAVSAVAPVTSEPAGARAAAPGPADGEFAVPTDDPAARWKLPWTAGLKWATVVRFRSPADGDNDGHLAKLVADLSAKGGGVVYFPPGSYKFTRTIHLADGVILRGAKPAGVTDPKQDGYTPPSKLDFPKYVPTFTGDGTPNDTAFKGVHLADPAKDSNCGLVDLWLSRGHVLFEHRPVLADDGKTVKGYDAGRNRLVVGCLLTNTAWPDPSIPDKALGQPAWTRYTWRFGSAVDVRSAENALVAGNRIPKSGEDNFTLPTYVLPAKKKGETVTLENKVVFDYDNRPGIAVNDYGIGGAGGGGPDGTPETHPWGFRKGIVIRDNHVWCSGRCAITFTGDGAYVGFNVIRFPEGVTRYTTTGRNNVAGSGTNDNRAVQMRGWRWTVEGNDYVVHRNRAGDTGYLINDGEGLMHEDHVNATVLDSKLLDNKGNTYLSIYKTAGINGLLVKGNDIRVGADGTHVSGTAIYVVADRNAGPFECRNVTITGNTTVGGIIIQGTPAADNVVSGNRHVGTGPAKLRNFAGAKLEGNTGYEVEDTPPAPKPKKGAAKPAPKADGKTETKPAPAADGKAAGSPAGKSDAKSP